jgi:hypothetical protein
MLINALNIETDGLEKSYLSNPYTAGAVSIEVKNNNRFAANDRIMLGEMGNEATEIVTVSSVNANGTTLVIGATVFNHSADDPVYQLPFDQVKFYRSTTGSTGSYSVLSTQNMDVDNADLETKYDDTTGLSTYYYKFTFYHSISTVESAFSDVLAGLGWRREQAGHIIDEVLQEVADLNEVHITRTELLGYFNDVNDDLQINVGKPYDFLRTTTTLQRTLNLNYVAFPTDSDGKQTMWKFDRMDYNFTDTTVTPNVDNTDTITVIPIDEFRNTYIDNSVTTTNVSDDKPNAMALDTAQDRFLFASPFETTDTNALILYYWKYFTVIDSEGDVIETPTPRIYKLYTKGMYYRKRAISDPNYQSTADRYFADYTIEKNKYKGVDRKDAGSPRSFRPETNVIKSFRR